MRESLLWETPAVALVAADVAVTAALTRWFPTEQLLKPKTSQLLVSLLSYGKD